MGDNAYDLRAWSFVKPAYVLSWMNDALNCLKTFAGPDIKRMKKKKQRGLHPLSQIETVYNKFIPPLMKWLTKTKTKKKIKS